MRILAVDVGTGTQDILLLDSEQPVENAVQLILPSPTVIVAGQIRDATRAGRPVLLAGRMMGGGPCHWAAMDHIRAGLPVYATPAAAQTFDDDLAAVERMGVRLVDEAEADRLEGVIRIELRDFYYEEIMTALRLFGVEAEPDAIAVAVFDHGAAPPGYSDRRFRFEYLARRLRETGGLSGFAYLKPGIPEFLTRLRAVADSFDGPQPFLVMDTGPAAVLGALEDERVKSGPERLVVNIGNFHTLAFYLRNGEVLGLFEHHTGQLDRSKLEAYLQKLAAGTVANDEVFADMGHGALVFEPPRRRAEEVLVAVTGPRRGLLRGSRLGPYFAVPHGDMMLAGCFGLIRAFADHHLPVREAWERILRLSAVS